MGLLGLSLTPAAGCVPFNLEIINFIYFFLILNLGNKNMFSWLVFIGLFFICSFDNIYCFVGIRSDAIKGFRHFSCKTTQDCLCLSLI